MMIPLCCTVCPFCVVYWYSMARFDRVTGTAIGANSLHGRDIGLVGVVSDLVPATIDSLSVWAERYQQLVIAGVRSEEVAKKIALQLSRFLAFYIEGYGHDRVSTCLRRDVVAWQQHLQDQGL